MVRKTCRRIQSRLLPLLAGEDLIGQERRRAERHVVACPDCRRALAALRETMDLLHTAAATVPPAAVGPSLWPDLARQIRETRRPASIPWIGALSWPAVALAASLMLTVGALLTVHPEPHARPITVRAPVPPTPVAQAHAGTPAEPDRLPSLDPPAYRRSPIDTPTTQDTY